MILSHTNDHIWKILIWQERQTVHQFSLPFLSSFILYVLETRRCTVQVNYCTIQQTYTRHDDVIVSMVTCTMPDRAAYVYLFLGGGIGILYPTYPPHNAPVISQQHFAKHY